MQKKHNANNYELVAIFILAKPIKTNPIKTNKTNPIKTNKTNQPLKLNKTIQDQLHPNK